MSRIASTAIVLFALLAFGLGTACAQGRGRGGPPPQGPPRAQDNGDFERSSLSDSVRRIQRDTRGQVLGAERVPFDGREVHRVKVLDDRGRVRVYVNDPKHREDADRPRRPTRDDDD